MSAHSRQWRRYTLTIGWARLAACRALLQMVVFIVGLACLPEFPEDRQPATGALHCMCGRRLAQVGYDSAKLQEGRGLQRIAQTAFETWRSAARTTQREPQLFNTAARATYSARQMGFPVGTGLITVNNPASVDTASVNLAAALADRDGAVQQLDAWMKSLTQAAQEALRDRPDLFKRLQQ